MERIISQKTLSSIIRRRAKIEALEKELAGIEQLVFDGLQSGATVQNGMFVARVKETSRRNVAWREVCERKIDELSGKGEGEKYCDRVLAGTPPTKYERLQVELAG